jgi:hypothetical protein
MNTGMIQILQHPEDLWPDPRWDLQTRPPDRNEMIALAAHVGEEDNKIAGQPMSNVPPTRKSVAAFPVGLLL